MQNSKNYAKSRGIVAFATNTEVTDYISIAHRTIKLASRVLELPYTLITDADQQGWVNHRYDIDRSEFVEWKNIGRHTAYQLSPYDETLVIDVDYVVQDQNLLKIFDTDWDYLLQRHSHSMEAQDQHTMGPTSLPYVWATVFAFRKTPRAQRFFDLVGRIQNNYGYYRELFNVQERNYRNDYAFAMADIILTGYTVDTNTIPGSMLTVYDPISKIELGENFCTIRTQTRAYIVPKTNLHIISKNYLLSDDFSEFINNVVA